MNTKKACTISVIIPAAGCGSRAALGGNKILATLCGRAVLSWTLEALAHSRAMPPGCELIEIIVAAQETEWPLVEAIFATLKSETSPASTCSMNCRTLDFRLARGGASRQDSVAAAVEIARGDFVVVHDAARPLASPALIVRVIEAALECGGAIAALPVSDTVKLSAANGNFIASTLERSHVYLAQTPQVFERTIFKSAFAQAARDNFQGTDCASLVERAQNENRATLCRVALVEGETSNFKITFAEDLERAARWMESQK